MFRSILGFASAVIAANALAHHSYTEFDDQRTVEIEGVLTNAAWQNPHVKLQVRVTDAAGNVLNYDIETSGFSYLRRYEVPIEIYAVGSTVKVAGWPSKRSSVRMYGTNLLSADGRETALWRSQPRWAATAFAAAPLASEAAIAEAPPATSIFQTWSSGYARPGIPDDPDASPLALFRVPLPLTAAAQERAAKYDPVTQAEQGCTPKGMPIVMVVPLPIQLVDGGDTVLFRQAEFDVVRTFHLNADPSTAAVQPKTPLGYSIARWEGDTLVVETSRVDSRFLTPFGHFSANAHYVERFWLSSDGARLRYSIVLNDPDTLTQPVEQRRSWIQIPGETFDPFPCIEESLR